MPATKTPKLTKKTVFPLRFDPETRDRLVAVQKLCVPPDYSGSPYQGPRPTITMADLVRWITVLGLERAEEMVGISSKGKTKGGR
jgi:hypothetical protein